MPVSPELAAVAKIDFDPDVLKAKYLAERDKRLREDGNDQYVEPTGDFSHFVNDPYVERVEREPVFDHVEFAIIGGGFGGLLTGAQLRKAGFTDIRVVESAGDFGGTWYWNRYPGAMCDVESYCYLPLLEELNYIPKHKYSFGPEILEHSKAIAAHFELYDNALLQTNITEMRWGEKNAHWIISTDRGDRFTSQFVAMANGALNKPKLPGIPGINAFKGHTFHTSRWDYGYTGGDAFGGLTKLKDKRVGIIGTGATAIQCIPHLGEWAKELFVFQRTPSSIDVRNNGPTDPAWAASLTPGWQAKRQENFNILVAGGDQDVDLVMDGWTDIMRLTTSQAIAELEKKLGRPMTAEERGDYQELADYRKMNQVRARVDEIVKDSATAEKLKPWYRQFCKRPCFHDEYLPTYNRPNVHLVDTNGKGVDALTEDGLVVDGEEYKVDCLIFATGFELGTVYTRRAGYDVIGREGKTLSRHWGEGLKTFQGLTTHGFPNCFFLGFTQTAITISVPQALNEQARHLVHMVAETKKRGAVSLEPTEKAETDYVAEIRKLSRLSVPFYTDCTPGYYNSEGKVGDKKGLIADMYGAGPLVFFKLLDDWREAGQLEGLELKEA